MTDLHAQLQAGLAGSYTLERELGRGGMAMVFLAQDLKHDRPVALKVLHPELAQSLGPERFLRPPPATTFSHGALTLGGANAGAQLRLAGGTTPFRRKYTTICP
jgi:eukaryotic-like serine/threonine-protein kinase